MQSIFSYSPLFCDELHVLGDWETVAGARSGQYYFTGEDVLQVYWQTVNSGLQRNEQRNSNDMDNYVLRFKYIHWLRLDRFEWIFKATVFLILLAIFGVAFMTRMLRLPQKQQRLGDNDLIRRYRRIFKTRKGV